MANVQLLVAFEATQRRDEREIDRKMSGSRRYPVKLTRLTQGGQTEENDSGPRSVELLRPFLVTSAIRQRHATG
jgi:hypothetical protein